MPQNSFTQSSPSLIFRSKMFSLKTVTYFACNFSYTSMNTWNLKRIDITPQINIVLSSNPTAQSGELVIQANTLDYGLYQFSFNVDITLLNIDGTKFNAVIDTFIKIIPTGLAIFAIQNGISNILIGSGQSYILNPLAYSFDFDNYATITNLKFLFYCNSIDLTSNLINTPSTIDLLKFKSDSKLAMAWNKTCFNSNSINTFYILNIN